MKADSKIFLKIAICLFMICCPLVILINLLLIKPVLKREKNVSLATILSLFLIFSVVISCFVLTLQFLMSLGIKIHCHLFHLINTFYLITLELSALNIMINSYFTLTNNHLYLLKKKVAILIFTLITWVTPLLFILLFFLYKHKMYVKSCLIIDGAYNLLVTLFQLFIEVASCIICIIMLIFLCRLNIENNEILKISKKKSIIKKISFIIGKILFRCFRSATSFFSQNDFSVVYFSVLFCLVFLAFEFIFLWNQHLKEAILITYCCKPNEEQYGIIDTVDTKELIQYTENSNTEK